MDDIKSALEKAMEKAEQLGKPSDEERLEWQWIPEGRKVAANYLRNEGDFRQFYWLQKRGKDRFGTNWPFSLMDMYVMDEYFR